ncbi:hypothetical protein BC829DRAFT_246852 [Chytridium lagenaria]|nr:hypothetical protein BC829DRAFT_246852 [Chytridium lagenaria]
MEIPTAYDWLLLYLQNFELIRLSKQSTKTMQLSRGSTPIVELSRSSTPLSEASNLLVVEEPEFSLLECRLNQKLFKGAVELLDHLILDYTSLKFQNSLLAAGVFQMQALVEGELSYFSVANLSKDDEMLATTGFSVGQLSEVLHFIENFDVYWMCQNDVTIQSDKFYLQTPTNLSAEKMVYFFEGLRC